MVTQILEDNKPLAAIVCGYERGGTTLVNQILKQHPKLDSGFECGFLLVENLANFLGFEPYHGMLRAGWKIVEPEVKYICDAENWPEAYRRLLEKSRVITNKNVLLFDKTPKYMQHLSDVLKKVPNVPCIVIVRDPRGVISSWMKRQGKNPNLLNNFCERYVSYGQGWKSAIENGYGDRILLVQYENLCSNPQEEAEKIFKFIGFDFDPSYLYFNQDQKFNNVHETTISAKYLMEYKQHLNEKMCQTILLKTAEFKDWHWNPEPENLATVAHPSTPQKPTQILEDNKPLVSLVCGFEGAGTTVLTEILRQNNQLDSGFECGFLLVDNIADFPTLEPYSTMLKTHWGISNEDLSYICGAENWPEAYKRLRERALVIKNKDIFLFDKTPKYMQNLSNVLKKVPNVPCIVLVRDPRAMIYSWSKRLNSLPQLQKNQKLVKDFCERYLSYARGYKTAVLNPELSSRLLQVQYESLCIHQEQEAQKIMNFIGFEFKETYLSFTQNNKFPGKCGKEVSQSFVNEYEKHLSPEVCDFILNETQEFKEWHWNGSDIVSDSELMIR